MVWTCFVFTTFLYQAPLPSCSVHKIDDSNPRHTPLGSSIVKVDGNIWKSAYEFLFESGKKNDVGRTV